MNRLLKLLVVFSLISFVQLIVVPTNDTIEYSLSTTNNSVNKAIISSSGLAPTIVPDAVSISIGSIVNNTDGLELVKPLAVSTTLANNTSTTFLKETKVPASARPQNATSDNNSDMNLDWKTVDVVDEERNTTLVKNNITSYEEEHHDYYNSTIIQNENFTNLHRESIYAQCVNLTVNKLLSKSHRRAMTVKLPFDFPFYGHPIRNILIATGGFLYTGDYIHSWLAATQYVSPLMANFDTSISNDSFVKYCENDSSFHVYWEKVYLQNKPEVGAFTFSASLYDSGDIVFAYYFLPIEIERIEDDKHPVKVGVSDAYIIDKTVFHARRKTIFEYNRVNFGGPKIRNDTTIRLTALSTCLSFDDCDSCLTSDINFKCSWCPLMKRCSNGVDRKRQEWTNLGCDKAQITDFKTCALLESTPVFPTTTSKDLLTSTEDSNKVQQHYISTLHRDESLPQKSSMGIVTTLSSIFAIAFVIFIWIVYAYSHPHTSSGQFLINYARPSAWSFRRGEARYTAASIHM